MRARPVGARWIRLTALAAMALVAAMSQASADASPASPRPVPILMYHVLAAPPHGAPFPELYVPPASFRAEMAELAREGFHPVTLDRLYASWTRGAPLPARPIVLSFDDGYRSDYTTGYRVLRTRRWPGVLNLEVHNTTVSWGLSPGRIRRMIAAGWEIDSHTLTHPDLTTVDPTRLRREVAASRAFIRREFHVPVDFFCYPSGRYDAAVVAEVQRAGYLGATTTQYGLAGPKELFTLARVRVDGTDGPAGLAAKLRSLGVWP